MRKKRINDDEDYELDSEEKRLLILKRLGITILVILGILVIFMLLKSCGNTDVNKKKTLNSTLLEAGKEYYEYNEYELPNSIGECSSVSLLTLSEKGLLNKTDFPNCENDTTYVKVCKLKSGKYQFVALLDCTSENTDSLYENWSEGEEKDVITDSTDVKFEYQVEYLKVDESTKLGDVEEYWEEDIPYKTYKTISITKYYRYRNIEYTWYENKKEYYSSGSGATEYYITSPAAEFENCDSENSSVSKYFSTESKKEYYLNENGEKVVSATAPNSEYTLSEDAVYETRYKTRSWIEVGTPVTVSPTKIYHCSNPDGGLVNSYVPCEKRTDANTITNGTEYSCDGAVTPAKVNDVCYQCASGGLKTDKTSCGSYGEWSSKWLETPCDVTKSDVCTSKTITLYHWYKLVKDVRTYYPSNSSTASGEKVYYASAPKSGLIADTTTTTKGCIWYKTEQTETSSYSVSSPSLGAEKTNKSRVSSWTSWSTSKPSSSGASETREIQEKNKIKLKQILGNESEENYVVFNTTFMKLDELLQELQTAGYNVYSLDDINSSGELKYDIKMYVRNKSEVEK